jgi:hypothetical protein
LISAEKNIVQNPPIPPFLKGERGDYEFLCFVFTNLEAEMKEMPSY